MTFLARENKHTRTFSLMLLTMELYVIRLNTEVKKTFIRLKGSFRGLKKEAKINFLKALIYYQERGKDKRARGFRRTKRS